MNGTETLTTLTSTVMATEQITTSVAIITSKSTSTIKTSPLTTSSKSTTRTTIKSTTKSTTTTTKAAITTTPLPCPNGWKFCSNFCFKRFEEKMTSIQAFSFCPRNQPTSYLAEISTHTEFLCIQSLANNESWVNIYLK